MVRYASILMVAAAVLLLGSVTLQPALAQGPAGPYDLFYNYYAPAGSPAGVAVAMYPCPRPTPPLVGYTYVTYQPLMPQEFLYNHELHYRTCYPDGSRTHTTVTYNHMHKLWPFQPSVMWSVATPHTPTSVSCLP